MNAHLTRVTSMRIPRIRHLSPRFGKPSYSAHAGRGEWVHYFESHAVFGLLRWHGNEFGSTHCECWISRKVARQETVSLIHGVTPGQEISLTVSSVANVRRVLALVRDIKARNEVSLDYWRCVHERLIARVAIPRYRAATHAAYLQRLQCDS